MARLLVEWPAAITRSGTVITAFGETIPFCDYMLSTELILLIRSQPDAQGTRRVIMKIADVVGIRISEAVAPERFTAMGFQKHGATLNQRRA